MKNGKRHTDMDLLRFNALEKVLYDYAVEVRNLYQDNLIQSDRIASGDLLNSVEFEVTKGDESYEVSLILADYWKAVEFGTKPHHVPYEDLLRWVKIKPVIPRPGKDGQIPSQESLAYLIQRSIGEKGTQGSEDLTRTLEAVNEKYEKLIADAMDVDLAELMDRVFFEDFGKQGRV